MPFTYEQVFAVDPANTDNVAGGASVLIFAPGDTTKTPLTITTPDGAPLANPIPTNANGFGSAFAHATLDRVAWEGGGFTGFFTSYEGMKQVAVDAKAAAEDAAVQAEVAATAPTDAAVAASVDMKLPPAINDALANNPSVVSSAATLAQSNASLVPAWKASTTYASGQRVVAPNGDVVAAKAGFTSTTTYDATKWNPSAQDGRVGALEATKWARPSISSGSLDTAMTPGVYDVKSIANTTGRPVDALGELTVMGTTYPVQTYTTWDTVAQVFVRRYISNAWSTWLPLSHRRPYLATGTDLDTCLTPGVYGFAVTGILHLPTGCGDNGTVEVLLPSATIFIQRVTDWVSGNVWTRRRTAGGTWYAWVKTGADYDSLSSRLSALEAPAPASATLDVGAHQHLMREVDLRRRTGPISTGNKAAVSLIFDHGTLNFRDIVLPLLRQYNIRATLALNSRMMDTSLPIEAAEVDDWATVAGWYQNDGIEIANHTATHENASGYDAIKAEIIGGREALETSLNGASTTDAVIYVDSFVQPGTRTSTIPSGQSADAFDGFGDGVGLDKYYKYTAGRLIIDGHACVSGNVPHWGQVYPLDGTVQVGSNGKWLDAGQTGIDSVNTMLNDAVTKKGRCIIRSHPQYIGLTNYITAAQMQTFIASLAARRDAGDLVILPFREWNVARL